MFEKFKKNKKCQKVITICKFRHPIDRALKKDKRIIFCLKIKIKFLKDLKNFLYIIMMLHSVIGIILKKIKNLKKKTHSSHKRNIIRTARFS